MGSGSSKKNKETATKSNSNNTSENAKSDTAVKNHESESTKQNEEKKILPEKPDAVQNQTAMSKETKSAEASNQRKLSNGDHLSWMETDLSELMGGLELSDDPCVWEQYVDDLICKRKPEITPEKERRGWKTIRLFVSSTFKDMNNERDYLVKVIFPQLREWCEERKLRLVECDLRWGVPKDADTRETLTTCLSELDRCREENIYPYFLSLVSERFGWVPKIEEIPDDIRARYKWMPGMSVTTSEIMVGGYWGQNRNALFLMRTPDYLDHVKDEKVKSYMTEKNDDHKRSLSTLKKKLRTKYPKQVHDYSCTYEKEAEGKLYLSGFEEMGKRVLQHFKTMLSLQYPTDSLGLSPTLKDVLKLEHETFMFQRSQVLLGREESVQMIHSYIDDTVKEHVPLVLAGFPGSGKSALIAYTVKQCLTNKKYKVFYHFIGATPGSTDLFQILQRFFLEFMPEGTKMPDDLQEMKRYAHTMFKYAAQVAKKEGYQKIVVFLDALNQMDDDGDAHYLVWLPKKLPEGMRIIVSTLEGKCLNSLRDDPDRKSDEKKSIELSVDPLVKSIRKNIVCKILAEYNKRLDDEQLEILTDKPDAGRPLWLTVACEELRVFGEFRKLTQKIRDLPIDMIGLLQVVLGRIVKDHGNELVQATLCLVETSRFGLLETELFELLAMQPSIPGAKIADDLAFEGRLPMAKWALVYVGLRQFLRPCGSSGEGRLDFHHRTMSKAVRKMYLSDQVAQRWWHQRLTEYFDKCTDMERKAEELPYHLECSADKEKLKEVLLSQDMFKEMYKDNSKQQLMKYWRFIGGYQIASESYYDSLKRFITDNNLTEVLDWAPIQSKTASFLVDIGEYTIAEDMLNEVITTLVEKYGKDSKELCEPTYCMVNLLFKKALQYVYGAHPGYRECRIKGLKISELCVAVNKKYFSKDKQYLGRVLLTCGYFERGTSCLEEAMNMFENINDQQGLAVALYMLGEKNQYHSDLSIPTEMFNKSMGLCSSMFGKFHLNTARCAQLHGQMLWNNWTNNRKPEFLENCLVLYQQEVEILCEVQGDLHPNTVRSREDVIIILQNLGRDEEAKKYQDQQPNEHSAL
ncbi:TPR repeat-containing protein DDB_G0287407-like isoform X1 [Mytilus galloprovincialis]|uniref:TPR repeat-containing protein DDB_G0287407-like isoform X1 n=1 Tax=Mytilus galloprovincialis TaxID=29158 RepID=UPI003F7B8C59